MKKLVIFPLSFFLTDFLGWEVDAVEVEEEELVLVFFEAEGWEEEVEPCSNRTNRG